MILEDKRTGYRCTRPRSVILGSGQRIRKRQRKAKALKRAGEKIMFSTEGGKNIFTIFLFLACRSDNFEITTRWSLVYAASLSCSSVSILFLSLVSLPLTSCVAERSLR